MSSAKLDTFLLREVVLVACNLPTMVQAPSRVSEPMERGNIDHIPALNNYTSVSHICQQAVKYKTLCK